MSADPFADLYVDGEYVNETPVFEYEVEVGMHVLRIERQGCQTIVDTVRVRQNLVLTRSYAPQCGGTW